MMSVLAWREGQFMMFTKGAPEIIMEKSVSYALNGKAFTLDAQILQEIGEAQSELSEMGLRVLGLAYKCIQTLPSNLPLDPMIHNQWTLLRMLAAWNLTLHS